MSPDPADRPAYLASSQWYRSAVTYQIYPRSFADSDGDGTGDLGGVIARLDYLAALGVDALWFNPWYPSPMADGGYDIIDYRAIAPEFGTLDQAEELIGKAHALGLKVLIDIVPNHCSDQHPWFVQALAAGPGSPERELFIFRDGKGPDHAEPPTNWTAIFGGSTWQPVPGEPGRFYLHLFAPEQPDWNWDNPAVAEEFADILRFWFDRGVDGFRIDVADGMAKKLDPLEDMPIDPRTGVGTVEKYVGSPIFDQPGVHDIYRRWRMIADSYADTPQGARVLIAEAWLSPAHRLEPYLRPDELHMSFNFDALRCSWDAVSLRNVIDSTSAAMADAGAPSIWVLANHDTTRVVSRYGKAHTGVDFTADGPVPDSEWLPQQLAALPTDVALGRRRARAAALLELALPGGAYIYQGDELGLDEVEDLPVEALQDPTWERSGHTVRGRDGARVPMPWRSDAPGLGFGEHPWLPVPQRWRALAVDVQASDPLSTLSLYRAALAERRRNPALGDGTLTWDETMPAGVLSFTRDPGFRLVINVSGDPFPLPDG